jgi:excisionase family DNA binding protein
MTANGKLLLTAKQAAETLAISERKLWSLTNIGAIPCVRIGRAVRYSIVDLNTWIDRHRTGKVDTFPRRGKALAV